MRISAAEGNSVALVWLEKSVAEENMQKYFSEKTCRWFESAVGTPTEVQRQGWQAIASGENVLISAPTGTGKTLTAFLMAIDRLDGMASEGRLEDEVQVLYISPLKALGNDIRENLQRPIEGLGSSIRTAVRNGDTTPSERRKMIGRPPHILITTPESLYLMLTSQSGRRMLATVKTVIIDELHAVISSRRGTHLMLSLARLDALCARPPQRIGLSATIRPLELAAEYLAGENTRVVAPEMQKHSRVSVLAAAPEMTRLREGSIWPEICREVYEASLRCRTVLVFCEGRATAEKVAHGVNALGGEGYARTHHGSISKEQRLEAERALKAGRLKVLCATSSMELGIDVGEVDRVIQIGCPQRISSAVQRLGRAGHRPEAVSHMDFYPRMRSELLLSAMTAEGMRAGEIEAVEPQNMCMDILAQHLISMAVAETYTVGDALKICRSCSCYRDLTEAQQTRVLSMLAGDDEHEADRPVSPRVNYDRLSGTVSGSNYSRMLALSSGGTIPDRGLFAVMLEDGVTRLGELDEEFVFEARLGDKFLLGAIAWTILRIERDRVIVRQSSPEGAQSPFWHGDGMGRSYATGAMFGRMLRELEDARSVGGMTKKLSMWTGDEQAALNIADYVGEQLDANGCLATDRTLVLEYFTDEVGDHQMMLHCPYGGRVNQGLAILMRAIAARETGCDVRAWHDDDGVLLHVTGNEVPELLLERIRPESVRELLWKELPGTALFSLLFRYNMNRALMMGVRPGGRVPLWVQRIRGAEALARAGEHPSHPLLVETLRDCMDRHIDTIGLQKLLGDVRSGKIRIVTRRVREGKPSPMTLSLRRQVEAELMYDYYPSHSVVSGLRVEDELQPTLAPDTDQLAQAHSGTKAPDNAEGLHQKLMIEGDLIADETQSPYEWIETLLESGRILYVEPGLWIAAEQKELYECAFSGENGALKRILRRCLRYRGPMTAEDLELRYSVAVRQALEELAEEGALIFEQGVYIHAEVYQRAQRLTIKARRSSIETVDSGNYAAFLAGWHRESGTPSERLAAFLKRMQGVYLTAEQWESVVLPGHTAAYRPAMLDELLANGTATWRISPDGEKVAFFSPELVDWDAEIPANDPTDAAQKVRNILLRRGASFSAAISVGLPGESTVDVLNRMAKLGDVVCDSFAPLRKTVRTTSQKQRLRARMVGVTGGRWEIARPIGERNLAEQIEATFDRWGILCRETAALEGLRFSEALLLLRQMEYTAQVRRGYFVRGLSGAQFVRAQDFERICSALREPETDSICLNAIDPSQAWGRILPHAQDRTFMCVAGTAVVTSAGEVRLVLERQGAVLRSFDAKTQDYAAVAEAFRAGRIFPQLHLLTVRDYPQEAGKMLETVGFIREMRDYVLDKRRI